MRYLGLDLGTKTLGIAISDKTNLIASSLKTIRFNEISETYLELEQIIKEYDIRTIVLGYPKNMNNTLGPAVERTEVFKKKLEELFKIDIELEDERMTSIMANKFMISDNIKRKKRKQKKDTVAAVIILQLYLDRKR